MDSWTQVDIFTTTAGIEPLGALLLELGLAYSVVDAQDFRQFLKTKWDYVEDDLMKLWQVETAFTVYLPCNPQGSQALAAIADGLARLRTLDHPRHEWGRLEYSVARVREQDWANSWKQYYLPTQVGERLVVCPTWESYCPTPGQVVVRIDPGMAFGTGTHASTRLCMCLLERHCKAEHAVLDLGCGSGILSISASLLGVASTLGVDIDQNAVTVAEENARINAVSGRCRFICGDLLAGVNGRFDVICINIVADVIIPLLEKLSPYLAPGGVVLLSGIIDTRATDVRAALAHAGYTIEQQLEQDGWIALAARLTD